MMRVEHLAEGVLLYPGDCRGVVAAMPDNWIDSVVTDPPYALVSIVKRFGGENAAPAKGDVYARASSGFMGKQWDTGETAFDPAFWREVMRVLKPGGHVIAASGTRTYHRLAVAIEDAGFEIRDMISWLYGSGFPKSHNQPGGWGTALKPACEPWVLARKPLIGTVAANVLAHGTGAINIDGCRVGTDGGGQNGRSVGATNRDEWRQPAAAKVEGSVGRWPANVIHDGSDDVVAGVPHRFFYSAKANAKDRAGSKHPTVKPIALMRYLCRLITPPGGVILDPFAGSGTTGEAARLEGFRAILIEREDEYAADIRNRMASRVPDLLEALL